MSTLELDVGDLRARAVEFTATELVVTLADGRKIATPLDWYPRLKSASGAERMNYEIGAMGIHWPTLDEDLSIAGMLKGRRGAMIAAERGTIDDVIMSHSTRRPHLLRLNYDIAGGNDRTASKYCWRKPRGKHS